MERVCRDKNVSERDLCQFRINAAAAKCMKGETRRVAVELR